MRRVALTIAAVVAVALIGWADYVTGPDIGFSLFYLIPIVICGWYAGRSAGIVVGFAAAIAWFAADASSRQRYGVSIWNGFTRLVIFGTQAWMMARLRADREQLKMRVRHEARLARTDFGTALPNLRAFTEVADRDLKIARDSGWPVCLLYIDLDDFKQVNDSFGHTRGDEVLRGVGAAILASIRGDDLPARIGGDEFVVLLLNVEMVVAERIAKRIHAEIADAAEDIAITATIGAAYFSKPPESAAALLSAADETMYAAKESGKMRVQFRRVG